MTIRICLALMSTILLLFFAANLSNGPNPQESSNVIQANADTVANAIEAYKAKHGYYPRNVDDANLALLSPGAGLLTNDLLPPTYFTWRQDKLLRPIDGIGNITRPPILFAPVNEKDVPNWKVVRYGAMYYDGLPTGKNYLLYAIGASTNHRSIIGTWTYGDARVLAVFNH